MTAYFQYVRTHAYVTEDRRPQPLGTIPTPDGVPANLISEDPIAIRGAKVPWNLWPPTAAPCPAPPASW